MLTPGLQFATGCGCDRDGQLLDGFSGRKVQESGLEFRGLTQPQRFARALRHVSRAS